MKALVIGATGATGTELVKQLIDNPRFEAVIIFVRRPVSYASNKLTTHIVDFARPEQWSQWVKGDVAFSCMGTTLKAAGSKAAQWEVDYTYQYHFARAARANGVPHLILVSAYGAASRAHLFYPKMKGLLEEAVSQLAFPTLTIFQPGMLDRPGTRRQSEIWGLRILKTMNRLGLFHAMQPLPTGVLAAAMITMAIRPQEAGTVTVGPTQILQLLTP